MGRPGRRNAGWCRRGHDPRRHCLSTEEGRRAPAADAVAEKRRRRGRASFASLLMHQPEVRLGLRKKLRQQQQAKQRRTQERRAEAARERQLAQEGEHYPITGAAHDLF